MMKQITLAAALLLGIALLLAACGKGAGDSSDVKAADEVAWQYVQAAVEGNHELYKKILLPDQPRYKNLENGRHANPGFIEQMGERYSIYRFKQKPTTEGRLHYEIRYYLANHDGDMKEWLELQKVDGEWKVLVIKAEEAEGKVSDSENGVYVHEYKKEGEG